MQTIAESELILNKRGAIYHLDLLPEEIAPLIITVGDPYRVEQVSRHFDKIEFKRSHREFHTHTGTIGKKRISTISTGIGPDNIDIVFNELDALLNINLQTRTIRQQLQSYQIIRLGTAGALQANIPVDSYVASTHGLGIDNLLNFYRHQHNDEEKELLQSFITQVQLQREVSHPYITGGSPALLKHFVDGYRHGITVTCPGFYGPQGRILRLGLNNPGLVNRLTQFTLGHHTITNFEMETAAIYGLGKLLGHHCLSISAIVANRITKTFSSNSHATVEKMIKMVLDKLSMI
jgi:uridine phosphorylase